MPANPPGWESRLHRLDALGPQVRTASRLTPTVGSLAIAVVAGVEVGVWIGNGLRDGPERRVNAAGLRE